MIKDNLFLFMDGECTKQDFSAPVSVKAPLDSFSGTFSQLFRESNLLGKVDYQLSHNANVFYRYSCFANFLPLPSVLDTRGSGP